MTQFHHLKYGLLLTALALRISAATLTADYRFQGNLNDSLPGGTPLTGNGGTVGATTYDFSYGQGLFGSGILADGGDYSLVIRFLFTENASWNKFVDFKNRTSDCGQYVNGTLNFFCLGAGGPTFTTDVFHNVVLTRNGTTGLYSAYLDGNLAFSVTDLGGTASFSINNRTMYFMGDDLSTSNAENSPGSLDRIRIYDGALTQAEISNLDLSEPTNTSAVPEPQTAGIFAAAAAGLVMLRRRVSR